MIKMETILIANAFTCFNIYSSFTIRLIIIYENIPCFPSGRLGFYREKSYQWVYVDIAEYDGSGKLNGQEGGFNCCDKVENTILSFNIMYEMFTGKRTVEDVRAFYTNTMF